MKLRIGSVCSGIGGAELAFDDAVHVFASEIEAFPRAVLRHHYPDLHIHGDFTTIKADAGPVDVLVGGTPCQSFSVAGLRGGLADERGNLALEYLRLAQRLRPTWILWENVPGVLSSNGGRDFGTFVGGLAELGYGWAYRCLDAQYFGLAQRRNRVFVVGCLGDWRRAVAVLFKPSCVRGHPAPSREAGQRAAPTLAGCSNGGGANGPGRDADTADSLIAASLRGNSWGGNSWGDHAGDESKLIAFDARQSDTITYGDMAGPLDTCGHSDASEDGTGRGTPLVAMPLLEIGKGSSSRGEAVAFQTSQSGTRVADTHATLDANNGSRRHNGVVAIHQNQRDEVTTNDTVGALNGGGGKPGQGYPAVAFTASEQANSYAWERDVAPTLHAHPQSDTSNIQQGVRIGSLVRRLTPTECERLQGVPDGWTNIPYRGRPAADGPRYRALGNAFAVPVVRWIARRIARENNNEA